MDAILMHTLADGNDPDVAFNDGLGAGIAVGMKNAWVRYMPNDQETWPDKEGPYVTYSKSGKARVLLFERQGDMSAGWVTSAEGLYAANPMYWTPIPV